MACRLRLYAVVSAIVTVHPHEISALLHSSSCFFFILSAYFVVLPLRDKGAISLGLSKLQALFVGSLFLTLIAAPLSTLIFSLPNLSKSKVLVYILHVCFLHFLFPINKTLEDEKEKARKLAEEEEKKKTEKEAKKKKKTEEVKKKKTEEEEKKKKVEEDEKKAEEKKKTEEEEKKEKAKGKDQNDDVFLFKNPNHWT